MDYIISFIIKDSNNGEACEVYERAGCAILGIKHYTTYNLDITGRILQYTGYGEDLSVKVAGDKLELPKEVIHAISRDD